LASSSISFACWAAGWRYSLSNFAKLTPCGSRADELLLRGDVLLGEERLQFRGELGLGDLDLGEAAVLHLDVDVLVEQVDEAVAGCVVLPHLGVELAVELEEVLHRDVRAVDLGEDLRAVGGAHLRLVFPIHGLLQFCGALAALELEHAGEDEDRQHAAATTDR
jgi:hypothetical protein